MARRNDPDTARDPERKRNGADSGPREPAPRGPSGPRRGRSGYGMESIRPHLRAQLDEQKLWRPTFPPEPDDEIDRGSGKARGR